MKVEAPEADTARLAASISEVMKLRADVSIVDPGSLPRDGVVIADLREAG